MCIQSTRTLNRVRTEDYVRVLFGQTDVQDTLAKLEKLATAELQAAVSHTYAMVRELHYGNAINDLRSWLCIPRLSNHREKSQDGSCAWFFDDRFEEWMTRKAGVYWVYGIPGAGKSVLWSSVVEKLKADTSLHVIHFYFDYSDPAKQNSRSLVSYLVFQVGIHSESCLKYLKGELTPDHPTDEKLRIMLVDLLALSGRTFLAIDALDECPERARDKDLLTCLEYICGLSGNDIDLRVLVTSRPEPDIRDCMSRLATYVLSLYDTDEHNDELNDYVSTRLSGMRSFRQWSVERRAKVQQTLVKKSEGM
ncbi:hypothetical protein PENSPDRAFT_428839 [Peniophora sp. CONT]|nr:hypothetical protein PENSPDRAFT_428839 [Peniophora sp. CONT]